MKITCLCVTEKREAIFGIAASSYGAQEHLDKELQVALPTGHDPSDYIAVLNRLAGYGVFYWTCGEGTIQERLDYGCIHAFKRGADLVAIWDDDDFKPPSWLSLAADDYDGCDPEKPYLFASRQGWFVNLRTLRGEFHQLSHCWGGSLIFNEAAWAASGGFAKGPWPGQDRAFVEALAGKGTKVTFDFGKEQLGHVAFSHGKNVQTYLRGEGEPMKERFDRHLPLAVWNEVHVAREFLLKQGVYPPQPGGYDE